MRKRNPFPNSTGFLRGILFVTALCASGAPAQDSAAQGERPPPMRHGRMMRTCLRCHADIVDEWKASGHARAWTDPRFQAAIAERDDGGEACTACHAPESVLRAGPGQRPEGRSKDRELGVTCVTCHVNGRDFSGPIPSQGHNGIVVREEYRRAEWCLGCHGQEAPVPHPEHGKAWAVAPAGAGPKELDCQQCHMPAVTRVMARARRPLKEVQPAQELRRHRFGMSLDENGIVIGAARLAASFDGDDLHLRLTPHSGHPLALRESRALEFRVRFLDGAGEALGEPIEEPLGERLAPGEESRFHVAVPTGTASAIAELILVAESGAASSPGQAEGLPLARARAERASGE